MSSIGYYRPPGHTGPVDSTVLKTLCGTCKAARWPNYEYINKAGTWDSCEECDRQNEPVIFRTDDYEFK